MSLRILLADDSMTAQNMGKKILTDGGYDVVTVSNGAAAMKKLAEFTPDLIIADVYMPGYNGLEICEKVKKAPATASVPVLLSVGKLEPFRPEDGVKVQADGIIIKPFEATDLLAVTAKLAERAAKPAAPEPPLAPPEAAVAATEEASAEASASELTAPEPAVAAELAPELPAFAMEETAPHAAPAYSFESASSQATDPAPFALDDHQPDYVREFGLDPHDAPTTGFSFANPYAAAEPEPAAFQVPESSFFAQLPHFDAQSPNDVSADEPVALAPASLNVTVNAVAFSAPAPEHESVAEVEAASDIQDEPVAPAAAASPSPEDDFEAKLAAAMAAYEAPVAETAAPTARATAFDSASALEAAATAPYSDLTVPSTWVAEEAPLSDTDMGLSLEEELHAFSAAAGAAAPACFSTTFAAPVGPLGDTSFDDEVATLVEQSKDSFFPSAQGNTATDLEPAVTEPKPDSPTLTERVNAVMDEAGFATSMDTSAEPASEAVLETEPASLTSFETPASETQPELTPDPSSLEEEDTLDFAQFDTPSATETDDVPELITHDIPSDWSTPSAPVEDLAPARDMVELDAVEAPLASPTEPELAEEVLLTRDDFTSHEAPFAHAAVDEVHDMSLNATVPVERNELAETTHESSALAASIKSEATNEITHLAASTPALDEAAISQVVAGVMDRMKGDIVAQIVKELAAKLGK